MIRLGIIGAGGIAHQFMIEAPLHPRVEVVAVVSRTITKAQAFASRYGISKVHATVSDLLADSTIDAVYIATPHPLHAPQSLQALQAQKHVLCEKPAALTPEQIDQIRTASKREGKVFMEAMTIGFHPLYQEIKQRIAAGDIGQVTTVESSFGNISQKAYAHQSELAGGCIYDIGIYNLFLQLDILGIPMKRQVVGRMHREWGVIGSVQMLASYEQGAHSYAHMSIDEIGSYQASIMGTKGTILIDNWTRFPQYHLLRSPQERETRSYPQQFRLGFELAAFVETIEAGRIEHPLMPHERSRQLQEEIAWLYDALQLTLL